MRVVTRDERAAVDDAQLRSTIDDLTAQQVRNLHIDWSGGRIRVTGSSNSYYVKQLVTHAVLRLAPEAQIHNEILVFPG